ncbi:MAG: hypothetical protein R6W06_09995 [Prochlorococcaceae cyanobacterium]
MSFLRLTSLPLAVLALALLLAMPVAACERHLEGHANSSGSNASEAP